MADVDPHAQPAETPRVFTLAQIGARNVELERAQDLGQAAHPDAADADEVHVSHAPAEHQFTPRGTRVPNVTRPPALSREAPFSPSGLRSAAPSPASASRSSATVRAA